MKRAKCSCCKQPSILKSKYSFSDEAWNLLSVWGEVAKDSKQNLLCDSCYWELRDTLIDRTDELSSQSGANTFGQNVKSA
jgi:hypothetical protein